MHLMDCHYVFGNSKDCWSFWYVINDHSIHYPGEMKQKISKVHFPLLQSGTPYSWKINCFTYCSEPPQVDRRALHALPCWSSPALQPALCTWLCWQTWTSTLSAFSLPLPFHPPQSPPLHSHPVRGEVLMSSMRRGSQLSMAVMSSLLHGFSNWASVTPQWAKISLTVGGSMICNIRKEKTQLMHTPLFSCVARTVALMFRGSHAYTKARGQCYMYMYMYYVVVWGYLILWKWDE